VLNGRMITFVYIAAAVLMAGGNIYLAWRSRDFRKFLAGAFFVSSGILFYLYLAAVGTSFIETPATSDHNIACTQQSGNFGSRPVEAADALRHWLSQPKVATNSNLVVFESGIDPLGVSLVASLNPGGNLAGVNSQNMAIIVIRERPTRMRLRRRQCGPPRSGQAELPC
jgi:hypothetical protein